MAMSVRLLRSLVYVVWLVECGFWFAACGFLPLAPLSDGGTVKEVTLSQTTSASITTGVGCQEGTTNYIRENNFYRAFKLADYGVADGFRVKKVTFGVFSAHAGAGSVPFGTQPAEILIYAYTGTLGTETIDLSKLTRHGDVMIQIRDTMTPTTIDIPVDAALPAGTAGLVVQFHIGNGTTAMHQLQIGANQQGEQAPAYQLAPLCGQTSPVSFPMAGLAMDALVLSVTGDG